MIIQYCICTMDIFYKLIINNKLIIKFINNKSNENRGSLPGPYCNNYYNYAEVHVHVYTISLDYYIVNNIHTCTCIHMYVHVLLQWNLC